MRINERVTCPYCHRSICAYIQSRGTDEPLVWWFLRKVQVYDLPSPDIVLDDDGDLCFDWLYGKRNLSVSLSPSGRISWAVLVGEYQASGRFQWPDWSPELDKAFATFNG